MFTVHAARDPEAKLEYRLDYTVDLPALEQGNFQFFYSLLKETKEKKFENLMREQSETPVEEILKVFLPLDVKKLWDPAEGNSLAVAKVTFLLPITLSELDEAMFTDLAYLKKTLPRYKVTPRDGGYHVGGTLITPGFDVSLSFLRPEHPLVGLIPLINREKLAAGKIKVAFLQQDNFGKVFFFRTAKMASALSVYEDLGPGKTLVTQYILSNVINVPTKELIRKGMIENLQDVVRGARAAVSEKVFEKLSPKL